MAKYQIIYKCGHEATIELFGKETERQRKIEWLRKNCECQDCKKLAQNKEAKNLELPELEGSEKQVEWAEKIRAEKIEKSKASYEKTLSDLKIANERMENLTEEQKTKYADGLKKFFEEKNMIINKYNNLLTETSAKWFIENRF